MSAITNGQNGMKAVDAKDYSKGIDLLTKAINETRSPAWLLSRSQAYQNTKQYQAALDDADAAYHAAAERTQAVSKSQMYTAQYRRAVILLRMGRPADADACCLWSQQLIEGKKFHNTEDDVAKNVDEDGDYKMTAEEARKFDTMPKGDALQNNGATKDSAAWTRAFVTRSMALAQMEKLPKGDPGRKVTVERIPPKPKALGKGKAIASSAPASSASKSPSPNSTRPATTTAIPAPSKPQALRFDFVQTTTNVSITIYIKNAIKDLVEAEASSNLVTVSHLPQAQGATEPLYLKLDETVKPGAIKLSVTPNKVEVSLEKAVPGTKWKKWGEQVSEKPPVETIDLTESPTNAPAVLAAASRIPKPSGPPAYPTSSKSGPKDWDNLDGADDKDDGGDVNSFFKQIYKGATPEQQRAMMKSFTESNGTALSTDWQDVGSRKVETQPPDGVEAKKW